MKQLSQTFLFISYSLCFCAVLGIFWANLFFIAVFGIFVLLALVILDLRSLPNFAAIKLASASNTRLHLESDKSLDYDLQLDQSWLKVRKATFYFPQNNLLLQKNWQTDFRPQLNQRLSQVVTARKLGRCDSNHAQIAGYSNLRLWRFLQAAPFLERRIQVIPKEKSLSLQQEKRLRASLGSLASDYRFKHRINAQDLVLELRPYRVGDEPRHIDGKRSARYSQLITREFEALAENHTIIALDVGRALVGHIGATQKLSFYLAAVETIMRRAIINRDKTLLVLFADKIIYLDKKAANKDAIVRWRRLEETIKPESIEANYELAFQTINRLAGRRSLVFLLSDIMRPAVQSKLVECVDFLSKRHVIVTAGLKVPTEEKEITTEQQWSAELFHSLNRLSFEDFKKRLSKLGCPAIVSDENTWIKTMDRAYEIARTSSRLH